MGRPQATCSTPPRSSACGGASAPSPRSRAMRSRPATNLQLTCNPTRAHDAICRLDAPSQAATPCTPAWHRASQAEGAWRLLGGDGELRKPETYLLRYVPQVYLPWLYLLWRPTCCATCRRYTYYGCGVLTMAVLAMAVLTMAVLTMALFPIAAGRGVRCGRQDEGDGGRHGRQCTRHHGHRRPQLLRCATSTRTLILVDSYSSC